MRFFHFAILGNVGLFWFVRASYYSPMLPSALPNQTELEDQYIKHFGNQAESQFWDMARLWHLEHREPRLKRFCQEAHKLAGYGEGIANNTQVRPRMLTFQNPKYIPRMVDIAMYGIQGISDMYREKYYFWMLRDDYWYITAGESDDCVYYVKFLNVTTHEFGLLNHVCGIHIDLYLDPRVAYF